jgi:hypothetical protein
MAASDLVPNSTRLLRQGDVSFDRVNSEGVQYKIAGAINFLLQRTYLKADFSFPGVVLPGIATNGQQVIRLDKSSTIKSYYINLMQTGTTAADIVLNFDVYNDDGSYRGLLFGDTGANRVLINGNSTNVQRIIFGRDLDAGTNFTVNQGAATRQLGELNFTTFSAGEIIVPKIVSGSRSALNLFASIKFQEQ